MPGTDSRTNRLLIIDEEDCRYDQLLGANESACGYQTEVLKPAQVVASAGGLAFDLALVNASFVMRHMPEPEPLLQVLRDGHIPVMLILESGKACQAMLDQYDAVDFITASALDDQLALRVSRFLNSSSPASHVHYVNSLLDIKTRARTQQLLELNTQLQEEVTRRTAVTRVLRALAEASSTSMPQHDNFFQRVVISLASAYGARFAMIAVFVGDSDSRIRTIAFCRDGEIRPDFDIELEGNPCQDVIVQKQNLITQDVQHHYPNSMSMRRSHMKSYFGAPLVDSAARPMGIVAVMDDRQLHIDQWTRPVLSVFANRIAAELEFKRMAEASFAERERAQVTLNAIADGVITADAYGQIEYMNPVAEQLTGFTQRQAAGQQLNDVFRLYSEETGELLPGPGREGIRKWCRRTPPGDVLLRGQFHQRIAIQYSASPIEDRNNLLEGLVVVFRDVSQVRDLTQELTHQARHDQLTGLINRREFERRLERVIQVSQQNDEEHALCYLDLDRFKIVNDTCGHLAGDELLRQLSTHMQKLIRKQDTIARLGGDEFGVLLHDCPPDKAKAIAENLRQCVKGFRFVWNDKVFDVGVSIGVVGIDRDSAGLAEVLSTADAACYAAKDAGRNQIHIYRMDAGLLEKRQGEMQWAHRIQESLGNSGFCLYFQPIKSIKAFMKEEGVAVMMASGEVLLRMCEKDDTVIPPMAFIPVAERYHLITDIDRWVLDATLRFILDNEASFDGIAPRFAINLSRHSLSDKRFLSHVIDQFDATGVSPERICFEITETAAIANLTVATRFMSTLKGMGCTFALDDFGSGFSSFAYLKSLPVDYVKIDGHFIRSMLTDQVSYQMVAAIKQISQVMGIATIAEFVEDQVTLEALKDMGIDYVQGYGIAEPGPLAEAFLH